jgi:hypothetical protein
MAYSAIMATSLVSLGLTYTNDMRLYYQEVWGGAFDDDKKSAVVLLSLGPWETIPVLSLRYDIARKNTSKENIIKSGIYCCMALSMFLELSMLCISTYKKLHKALEIRSFLVLCIMHHCGIVSDKKLYFSQKS